jgi:tetratricopeptide (TPR) repeat protein
MHQTNRIVQQYNLVLVGRGLLRRLRIAAVFVGCAAYAASSQTDAQEFQALSQRASAALKSNPVEAAKLYREAVQIQPSWAEGWFYLGASLYEIERFAESQKAFEHAADLAADNGTVWAFLGLCEYQRQDYEKSRAHILKGEQLGLGDDKQFISSIRNHAAMMYMRQGKFGAAMEQLQPLAAFGDDSPATIENIGISALGLAYVPPNVPADKRMLIDSAGRAWWTLSRQSGDARALFEQLVKAYPSEPGVHYLYGLYLEKTQPDAALREFRRELQIRPSHVPARLQAAVIEMKTGGAEDAVEIALEAVKLEPANPYCYVALGRSYLSLEEPAKAAQALEAAVKLAPEDRQPHLYLAQAYRKLGRTADAEKEQAEFARLKAVQDPLAMLEGNGASAAH